MKVRPAISSSILNTQYRIKTCVIKEILATLIMFADLHVRGCWMVDGTDLKANLSEKLESETESDSYTHSHVQCTHMLKY